MNVFFVSLGCDKNLADSEHMLALLQNSGFMLTNDEEQAEVIVLNTCCFIHDAMEESVNTILEMVRHKETGRLRSLIVTGCLAQRFFHEMAKEIPEVDGIVGTNSYDEIVEVIQRTLAGERVYLCKPLEGLPKCGTSRIVTTGGHFAYLKIAEGCDKHCTYCVIPSIRGSYRSVPMKELLAEAKELAQNGVRELILVAQETTLYGTDLIGKKQLPELLVKLSAIEGIQWIRLLYCYPEEITEELARTMSELPKVCHYIDMPVQHCDDEILKRMGRHTTGENIKAVVAMLRRYMPDIAIRTTVICGFPGETEAEHEKLLAFIEEMRFDHLGAFAYSCEEGTPAAGFEGQLSEKQKEAWVAEVMERQQTVSCDRNRELIGRECTVFVEGRLADKEVYVGRTYRDAPDVDGYIFVESPTEILSGAFVNAVVTEASEYDLIGELDV